MSTPYIEPRRLTVTVPPDLAGLRADKALKRMHQVSTAILMKAKRLERGLLLDGQRIYVNHIVQAGQVLSLQIGDSHCTDEVLPAPGPVDIVYEDEDLVVVNKAAGVPCHPGPGHHLDSLGNFLMDYFEKIGLTCLYHPVHRLDRGTSGLMVITKHGHAQEKLKGQLHSGGFRRAYLAICEGTPGDAVGCIDAPIGRKEGTMMTREVTPLGRFARTHFVRLSSHQNRSLLQLELETGRTHQIRVHLAHIGHPLTGDFLYGQEDLALIPRTALHSAFLQLTHPITGEVLQLKAPLPSDMAALLESVPDIPFPF